MSKIQRYGGNFPPFARDFQSQERTSFGTENVGEDSLDGNINAGWLRGWGIISPSEFPPIQYFNALGFTLSQALAYLHQQGVPEWNAEQEYFVGSITQAGERLYIAKTGTDGSPNVGIDPESDDGTNWRAVPDGGPEAIEQATDGGTDEYVSAINTSAPEDGYTIRRDFQSANETTAPELDGVVCTTKDGAALREGALSGVHELQYDSGATAWRVLDPNLDLGTASTRDVGESPNDVPTNSDLPPSVQTLDEFYEIDSLGDADGVDIGDIAGAGNPDIVAVGGGNGDVYWYEYGGPKSWTKRTIDDNSGANNIEIEGACIGAFDGGDRYVAVADQGGAEVVLYTHGGDPTGAWTRTVLQGSRPSIQGIVAFDVDGDGQDEIVYAFEGDADGVGGVHWIKYGGGGITDPANWTNHEMVQRNGSWRILWGGLRDIDGDGSADQLAFTSRNQRNSGGDGVYYLTKPATVTDLWSESTIGTTPSGDTLNIAVGDFFGDGTGRDFAAVDHDRGDLYLFRATDGWSRTTIANPLSSANGGWNVAVLPGRRLAGHDSILFISTADNDRADIYFLDYVRGAYRHRLVKHLEYTHPMDDLIVPADLNGNGVDELVIPDSGANRLVWLGFKPASIPAQAGARLEITAPQSISNGTTLYYIDWARARWDSLGFFEPSKDSRITIPDGVHFVELIAGVKWGSESSTGERLVIIEKNAGEEQVAVDRREALSRSESVISTGPIFVEPGDYFSVQVRQQSGGDLDIDPEATFLSIKPLLA